jgi:protein SCO1/2
MKRLPVFIVLIVSILILSACGGEPIETNMSEDVQDFEFTTQDNETLRLDDLKGDYWIADFIFTNCETECLPMTSNMSYLQDELAEEGIDVQFVSFSIEPDYDTPEVLREYGESFGADFNNWHFTTGYDFETIKNFAISSFKSLVVEAAEGTDQITHAISFYLVNPDGEVIKSYNGLNHSEMDSIINDMKKIAGV